MSQRPLVFVLGLTVSDLLLWNWSLNGNHDILALVSGLTVPPLAVASLWLLALSLARLIGFLARQPTRSSRARAQRGRRQRQAAVADPAQAARAEAVPPRKIAA